MESGTQISPFLDAQVTFSVHKSTLVSNFLLILILILILECVRRQDPPNGKIQCESKRYAAGTSCFLTCDKGYIPLGKTFMTCKEDEDTGDFDWNIDQPEFVCVRPIGMFPYSILWQLFAHLMC